MDIYIAVQCNPEPPFQKKILTLATVTAAQQLLIIVGINKFVNSKKLLGFFSLKFSNSLEVSKSFFY